ncbi:putative type IV secretion system protein [Pectobacterium atrosepticum ICMP 1526]|uniref:type IV secretion system protein n=1 Tax=Pectobacterium atrosepticum TaxID=29471 RepID=UPI000500754B|nr:type IV secretion system protein [Pectobacterium atrosepticum]KFX10702.1 type IV secretion system protein [Pectobacterium atrosepticum]KMK87269.1 putative type IV secretion system protein [Pectobacterium atrosepticum ICMP 1526]
MKKKIKLITVMFISCFLSQVAFSSGIPVVDVAGIAKTVEEGLMRAKEAKQQFDQLKKEYEQTKNLHNETLNEGRRLYEGVTNFQVKDLLDNPTLNSYLPNKSSSSELLRTSSNISNLRSTHKLTSSQSNVQDAYDSMLTELETMQTAYDTSVKRSERIYQLSSKLDKATTPQEKADYQNAIVTEQNNLINEKTKIDLAKDNFDQKMKIVQAARRSQFKGAFSTEK